MGNLVEIVGVDTTPTENFYSYDSSTYSQLWIYPEKWTCGVSQETHSNAIPSLEYLNFILTYDIDSEHEIRYDADNLKEFLNSELAQELLDRVCNGWYSEWDGQNQQGYLNTDADLAVDELLEAIRGKVKEKDMSTWRAGEWLISASHAGVFAYMSDEDLDELADEYLEQAEDEGAVIVDSIIDVLTMWRDEELDDWLDRAVEFGSSKWDEQFSISYSWFDKTTLEVRLTFEDGSIEVVHIDKSHINLISDPSNDV